MRAVLPVAFFPGGLVQIIVAILELGGLCVPHLRSAARARGQRGVVIWLAETMMTALRTRPPGLERLAGETDDDAEVRAVLRQAIPARARPGPDVCMACLAAARAERDHLAQMSRISGGRGQEDRRVLLCADHLRDVAGLAGRSGAASILAWQAACHAASMSRMSAPPPGRTAVIPVGWLRVARRADPCCAYGICSACGRPIDGRGR